SPRPKIPHMRAWLTVLGAVLLLSGCGGSSSTTTTKPPPPPPPPSPTRPATVTSGQVKATLYTPTNKPKANAQRNCRVVVTDTNVTKRGGKIAGQIVDPLGREDAVTYDNTTKPIRNMAFTGQFKDYAEWPSDSRGYTLTFRVVAKTPKGTV